MAKLAILYFSLYTHWTEDSTLGYTSYMTFLNQQASRCPLEMALLCGPVLMQNQWTPCNYDIDYLLPCSHALLEL